MYMYDSSITSQIPGLKFNSLNGHDFYFDCVHGKPAISFSWITENSLEHITWSVMGQQTIQARNSKRK